MPSSVAIGRFNWVNLSTLDPSAAIDYYRGLFGWTPQTVSTSTLLSVGDKAVASLSRMSPEMVKLGVPPHWMCSIAVDDCDAWADQVEAQGGRVAAEPFDAGDMCRMAVCADPTGAHFALWQTGTHPGATLLHAPGSMSWHELISTDPAVSREFFTSTFGWEASPLVGPREYTLFYGGEDRVAGMMPMPSRFHGVSSFWLTYFAVRDCGISTGKAAESGGRVLAGPDSIPGLGHFSVVEDPQKALFGLISYGSA